MQDVFGLDAARRGEPEFHSTRGSAHDSLAFFARPELDKGGTGAYFDRQMLIAWPRRTQASLPASAGGRGRGGTSAVSPEAAVLGTALLPPPITKEVIQ